MTLITTNDALQEFCARAAQAEFITVDTEFLRESTYYAQLALIQIAFNGEGNSAVIDVLADGLVMAPVIALFKDPKITKVFHAARQDLEILFHDYDCLPAPFFDTQVAAMVAGYGEQVGYETLVRSIAKGKIDKASRFTDWTRRPLTDAQIEYARGDVTYLCTIYQSLKAELEKTQRLAWVEEELAALLDPALYDPDPRDAWLRVRTRTATPRFLAYVRELAEFRENFARERNIPRTRVFKDDALLEIAAQRPKSIEALKRLRAWPQGARKGAIADGAIAAITRVDDMKEADYPVPPEQVQSSASESLVDLLKVLLKAQSERHKVAMKLIATSAELEAFAGDPNGDHAVAKGWRKSVFGDAAMDLISGAGALRAKGKYVEVIKL